MLGKLPFCLTVFFFVCSAFAAQEDITELPDIDLAIDGDAREVVSLTRVDEAAVDIRIDGHLNEQVWSELPILGDYRVVDPDTLIRPAYATELRMFYTDKGLYASFDLEQPFNSLVQRHAPRDAFDLTRDTIGLNLDSSGRGRYGYWVTLALGDGQMDGTVLPERQYSREWDGAWYGATQTTDRGWSAEFFVPWSQMAMPKEEGTRRINFYSSRMVAHLNERWGWPALPRSQPRFMSRWQPVQFDGVDPRQQWSVFPYASSTFDRLGDNRSNIGLDLFWRPSSNFQATATVNPDFGSVESDNVDVNLTASETFFPEKRLFFQEGQEIFSTTERADGNGPGRLAVVNTRRIGGRPTLPNLPPGVGISRREQLQPAELLGATKATGQIGSLRYGILAAFEDDTDYLADDGNVYAQDGRNFGVIRALYEDNINATYRGLGFISTLVSHPDSDTTVHAADFRYLSLSGKWRAEGQFLYSDQEFIGDGTGATFDIAYAPQQGIKHQISITEYDETVDVNDLGFQIRNDLRNIQYDFEWTKSGLSRIRDFMVSPFFVYGENQVGLQVRGGMGSNLDINLNNRDSVSAFFGYFPGRYEDLNSFGNGTFKLKGRWNLELRYQTDASKPISIRASSWREGHDLYGQDLGAALGATWRPSDSLGVDFEVSYADIDGWLLHQEDGNFTSFEGRRWQPEFGVDFYPTAKQQIRVVMQWVGIRAFEDRFFALQTDPGELTEGPKPLGPSDDFSISQLNFQLRYRWQIAPLSDLFIVYTKGASQRSGLAEFSDLFQTSWDDPLVDQLVIKLRYRLGS